MTADAADRLRRAQDLALNSRISLGFEVQEVARMLTDLWPTRRNPWLQDVIDDLRLEQDGMCAICGRSLDTEPNEVDHVVPFRWGGGNERENIQLTHMTCNRAKGSEVDPKALLLYLEDRWMNRC